MLLLDNSSNAITNITWSTMAPNLPLRHKVGAMVTPGDRLGLATRNKTTLMAGNGTYIRQGHVYASIVGTLCASKHQHDGNGEVEDENGEKWIISVQSERSLKKNQPSSLSYNNNSTTICPQVGMLVVGRITRVMRPTQAMVDIVAIVPDGNNNQHQQMGDDNTTKQQQSPSIIPLHEPFSGPYDRMKLDQIAHLKYVSKIVSVQEMLYWHAYMPMGNGIIY